MTWVYVRCDTKVYMKGVTLTWVNAWNVLSTGVTLWCDTGVTLTWVCA